MGENGQNTSEVAIPRTCALTSCHRRNERIVWRRWILRATLASSAARWTLCARAKLQAEKALWSVRN